MTLLTNIGYGYTLAAPTVVKMAAIFQNGR